MAWHKAAAKATIHYGPRVFLTIGSILMGARIRVRPIPDAPAMTGHTLAVCASAVFLGRIMGDGRLRLLRRRGARGPAGLHGLAAGRAQTYHRLRRGFFRVRVARRQRSNKPLAVFCAMLRRPIRDPFDRVHVAHLPLRRDAARRLDARRAALLGVGPSNPSSSPAVALGR